MQVQKVGNYEANFKSRDKIQDSISLVSMDDSQLAGLAYSITNTKEHRRKEKRNTLMLLLSLPAADIISRGLLQTGGALNSAIPKANLPARAFTMGKTAAGWALIMGGIGAYNATKQAIASGSPGLRRFERKHPVQSLLVDLGVILGASALFITNRGRIGQSILKHFPESIKELDKLAENALTRLEKTHFNKNTLPKWTDAASKSRFAGAGKFILGNAVWIAFGAGLIKMYHDAQKQNNRAERVYYNLKKEQNAAADYIVDSLIQERILLAQQDMLLATALQEVMAKTSSNN